MLRSSGQSEENFEAMHAANPLRRGVEPTDVIEALRYLIGARCVTGANAGRSIPASASWRCRATCNSWSR